MLKMFTNWGPAGDFPAVGNVLEDDTTNGVAGTFTNVAEANVASGEQWGAGGTEFTGSGAVGGSESIFFLMRGK